MPADRVARAKLLWGIAFAAQLLVTILELIDHDYLKAVSAILLAVPFLLLATGMAADGPGTPLWRKVLLLTMVFASIGLLVYRVVLERLM